MDGCDGLGGCQMIERVGVMGHRESQEERGSQAEWQPHNVFAFDKHTSPWQTNRHGVRVPADPHCGVATQSHLGGNLEPYRHGLRRSTGHGEWPRWPTVHPIRERPQLPRSHPYGLLETPAEARE